MAKRRTKGTGSRNAAAPTGPVALFFWMPVGVVLTGFVIRLVAASNTWQLPLVRNPQLDSMELLGWASGILSGAGDLYWSSLPTHGALYPHFLALLLGLADHSLYAARMWQAAMGAGTVWMAMAVARQYYGPRTAVVTGLILAAYGPLVYIDISFYEEGLFIFLLVLSLLLASRARSIIGAAALGACLGAAAITRPTALVLTPLYAWSTARLFVSASRRWLAVCWVTVACLLVVSPVLARNYQLTGRIALRGFGGLNFFMGNRPGGQGTAEARIGEAWDRLQGEPLRQGVSDLAEQDTYFVNRAVQEIRQQPAAWLAVVVRKFGWLVSSTEIRDSHSYHFFAQESWLKWLPEFGVLFPLAVVGLIQARRKRTESPLLSGYLVLQAVTLVATVVGLRYRAPLVPVLAIFGAYGLEEMAHMTRRREWRALLPLGAIAAGCVLLSNVIVHRPSHNFSEEYAFTGAALVHERDLDDAEVAYRRATSADPSRAMGWNGLGVVALNRGLVEEAKRSLQTALLLEPSFARSHYLMGTALRRTGDLQGAVEQFRQAAAIRPDDTETQGALADALLSTGAPADALVHYRIVQQRTPPSAGLCVEMARAEGLLGHLEESRRLSEKAVALEPLNGRAWFTLAEAQRAAGDFAGAETSLQQAAGYLGAGVVEVRLAQAMLRRSQGRRDEAGLILWRIVEENPDSEDARRLLLGYAAEDGELARVQAALKKLDLARTSMPQSSGSVAR